MTNTVSVPFNSELIETFFIERPNRFLVRCKNTAGKVLEAHLADPGRLRELLIPGRRIWLQPAANSNKRKTAWSAVLVENNEREGWVSVDATLPNRLIGKALRAKALEELSGWLLDRSEFKWGHSRFDFLLTKPGGKRMVLEIKSVTLVEGETGFFPDAVTARGTRHVEELTRIAELENWEAGVLFVVQRNDATRVKAAAHLDPKFARALAVAQEKGVRILGRRCRVDLRGIKLGERIETN